MDNFLEVAKRSTSIKLFSWKITLVNGSNSQQFLKNQPKLYLNYGHSKLILLTSSAIMVLLSLLNTMFIKICYDPECALTEQSRKRSANLCIYLQIHCRKNRVCPLYTYVSVIHLNLFCYWPLYTRTLKLEEKKWTKDYTNNALVTLPIYSC